MLSVARCYTSESFEMPKKLYRMALDLSMPYGPPLAWTEAALHSFGKQ
jgi:hypothetical protein